jgi:hypothetical protein
MTILFQKMDEGILKTEQGWDFSSVDENSLHGHLLCLADIAWHSCLDPSNVPETITFALNVSCLFLQCSYSGPYVRFR